MAVSIPKGESPAQQVSILKFTLEGASLQEELSPEDAEALAEKKSKPVPNKFLKQTAVLQQAEQKVLLTQNFSGFEALLRDLSDGFLQEELERNCDVMLDEKELYQYFERLGMREFVELQRYEWPQASFEGWLSDGAIYASRLAEFEKKKSEILARADKQLENRLRINAGYKKIIDDCWEKFLILIKKSRGSKLEEFFDEKIDSQNGAAVDATHQTMETVIDRYKGLLPFAAALLKTQLSQQVQLYERALEYVKIIKDTLKEALKEDYPYFELRGFVDAQKIININPADAKTFLKNYKSAREALATGTIATLDHLVLSHTEFKVGGYMPTNTRDVSGKFQQALVYVSVPNVNSTLAEQIINLYAT